VKVPPFQWATFQEEANTQAGLNFAATQVATGLNTRKKKYEHKFFFRERLAFKSCADKLESCVYNFNHFYAYLPITILSIAISGQSLGFEAIMLGISHPRKKKRFFLLYYRFCSRRT